MKMLTPEERIARLRLLGERQDLERIDIKTPSQLKRLAELDSILESSTANRPPETRSKSKADPAAA